MLHDLDLISHTFPGDIDIFPISGNVKVKLNDKQDAVPKNYHMSTIKVIRAAENKKSSDKDSE